MQKSKLIVTLILLTTFNELQASNSRKSIEEQALRAIQKHDEMIQKNDNMISDLLWLIPISSALTCFIMPVIDKNIDYKDLATAAIFAISITSTALMFGHSTNRKELNCQTIEQLKSYCTQLGVDERAIAMMEIDKEHNVSDYIAFAKQQIQENITPK